MLHYYIFSEIQRYGRATAEQEAVKKIEIIGNIVSIYDNSKQTNKSFIYSGFKSYKEEKNLSIEKLNYGKPVIQYIVHC